MRESVAGVACAGLDWQGDAPHGARCRGVEVVNRNFVSAALHTKVLRRKHSAARLHAGKDQALLTPEPIIRLDVASSNVRGGFFRTLDRRAAMRAATKAP